VVKKSVNPRVFYKLLTIANERKSTLSYPPHKSKYFPIKSTTMTMYLMYKNMINNMEGNDLQNIVANFSENHLRLKQGQLKDAKTRLNH